MRRPDLASRGERTLTVCNACRYCEQYCPVFPAMERRTAFDPDTLAYLANLCHNCGECLYACQFAPPHQFGIDVPRLFAEIRLATYEDACRPRPLAPALRRLGPGGAIALAVMGAVVVAAAAAWMTPGALSSAPTDARFYAVVPHGTLVGLFGAAALVTIAALLTALRGYWRTIGGAGPLSAAVVLQAVREGLTLRHLHGEGTGCVSGEEARPPWRRRWHHVTVGGLGLCLASTTVAALYHALGWVAPYAPGSLPVVLGVAGGLGLLVGPVGQWHSHRRRDPALGDPAQDHGTAGFLLLLWLTSATGLLLLALRTRPVMPWLLVVHLGVVLALFLAVPFGKVVHGGYRLLALVKDVAERAAEARSGSGDGVPASPRSSRS
ncbi:MAG: tricarballylate utilization 4Fe-4S protein TcuB [Vicinamibacterales bacterium]